MAMETLINALMGASGAPRKAGANVYPFAEINKLYRMEEMKQKLQQLQNTYVVTNRLLVTFYSRDLLVKAKLQSPESCQIFFMNWS